MEVNDRWRVSSVAGNDAPTAPGIGPREDIERVTAQPRLISDIPVADAISTFRQRGDPTSWGRSGDTGRRHCGGHELLMEPVPIYG